MVTLKAVAGTLTVNIVGVGCVAVVALVSTLLMARWLPAEDFGRFSMLLLAFNGIAVLDGIRPVMVYLGAQNEPLKARLRTGMAVATAVGIAVALVAFTAGITIVPNHLGIVEFAVLALGLGAYFPMSCYWGLLDSQRETAFTGGLRSAAWTCSYGAFLAGAAYGAGPIWYVSIFCNMNLVLLAAYGTRLHRRYDLGIGGGRTDLAKTIRHAAGNTIVFNFGALVLASVDRLVLGWIAGPVQLGLYSAVYELTTKPAALLRVVSTVLYPEAARLQADTETLTYHWLRGLRIAFALVFCGACVLVLFRLELTVLLLGERFAVAADAFGLLALGFVFVVVGYFCGVTLNGLGDFESQRKAYSIAAAVMIVAAWPTVSTWGMTGAAALYLAVRTVDLALLWMTAKKLKQQFAIPRVTAVAALFIATAAFFWAGLAVPAIICLAALVVAIGPHREFRAIR